MMWLLSVSKVPSVSCLWMLGSAPIRVMPVKLNRSMLTVSEKNRVNVSFPRLRLNSSRTGGVSSGT